MNPLAIVKYIVEHLEGTPYAVWVNALLFMLFAVAVLAAISLLIGRSGRLVVKNAAAAVVRSMDKQKRFAPVWEAKRASSAPYVELVGSLYFAFVGLYSALLVGISAVIGHRNAPWWAVLIAVVWVLASFYYMRVNLVAASWAHHTIVKRKG